MDKHMEKEKNIEALREGYQETETSVSANRRSRRAFRTWMYTAIAIMLVMSAVMGSAWAYFTTYAKAKGGVTLKLGHEEHIDEEFEDWEKIIDLTSTEDSNEVYLRVKAFCAEYDVTYANTQNWTEGDNDWMYYDKTLAPGKSLSESGDQLKAKINDVPKSGDEGLEDGKTFNVIIVYESMEVQYEEKTGRKLSAQEADWSRELETTRTITKLGGGE